MPHLCVRSVTKLAVGRTPTSAPDPLVRRCDRLTNSMRSHEQWAIPAGSVFGDRNLGAAAPLFPGTLA